MTSDEPKPKEPFELVIFCPHPAGHDCCIRQALTLARAQKPARLVIRDGAGKLLWDSQDYAPGQAGPN